MKVDEAMNAQTPSAGEPPAVPAPSDTQDSLPNPTEILLQSLRYQGFTVHEDAHGLRLGGAPITRGSHTAELSPYDVVRLAAELDGGILPPGERTHCPQCDAVVPPKAARCQWCSAPLPPPASPPKAN